MERASWVALNVGEALDKAEEAARVIKGEELCQMFCSFPACHHRHIEYTEEGQRVCVDCGKEL